MLDGTYGTANRTIFNSTWSGSRIDCRRFDSNRHTGFAVESGIHAMVCDTSSFAVFPSTNRDSAHLKDRRSQRRGERSVRECTVDHDNGSCSGIVWRSSWTNLGAAAIHSVKILALTLSVSHNNRLETDLGPARSLASSAQPLRLALNLNWILHRLNPRPKSH